MTQSVKVVINRAYNITGKDALGVQGKAFWGWACRRSGTRGGNRRRSVCSEPHHWGQWGVHSLEDDHVGPIGSKGVLLKATGDAQLCPWIWGKVCPGRECSTEKEVALCHLGLLSTLSFPNVSKKTEWGLMWRVEMFRLVWMGTSTFNWFMMRYMIVKHTPIWFLQHYPGGIWQGDGLGSQWKEELSSCLWLHHLPVVWPYKYDSICLFSIIGRQCIVCFLSSRHTIEGCGKCWWIVSDFMYLTA